MTTTEIFKDIDNSSNSRFLKVQISNHGRIKMIYKSDRIDTITCGVDNGKGYKKVQINRIKYYIHRLVGQYFIENLNPELYNQIDHIDRNKSNNHYINLHWVTSSTNLKNRSPYYQRTKKGSICVRVGADKQFQFRHCINKKQYSKSFKTNREVLLAQKYYIALLPLLEFEFKL